MATEITIPVIRELQSSGKHAEALALLRNLDESVDAEVWRLRGESAGTLGIASGEGALLEESVSAWRRALALVSRDSAPLAWADTKVRLGDALFELGLRGSEKLMAEAFQEYWGALEACTPELDLHLWVRAGDGIARVWLRNEPRDLQGGQAMPMGSFTLLVRAENVYRAMVERIPRETEPECWATSQVNLGRVYARKASRVTDKWIAIAQVQNAIAAFRSALEVYRPEEHPVAWANTQAALALAFENLGKASRPPANPASVYRKAIDDYHVEIERFRRNSEQGNANVAVMYKGRAHDSLRTAIEVFPAASEVLRREHPDRWAGMREKLAGAYRELGGKIGPPSDPIAAYRAAVGIYRELRKDSDARRVEMALNALEEMRHVE